MSDVPLRNFHNQMVEALGRKIVGGEYGQGEQLPTEPQLAAAYGASRMIIREAMKSLAAKGLVSIGPRVGTHVLPRTQWNLFDPSVLGWHTGPLLDEKLIADLMELRRAIEPLAARLAAERGTAAEVESVRKAYLEMKNARGGAEYIAADLRFHGAVVRACGNQFILQLENALAAVWKTSFEASSDGWGADSQALALHETLVDAIEARDGAAAEAAVLALIGRATVRIRGAAPATRTRARSRTRS